MKTIIRSAKGEARRETLVSKIQIPDLWHVGMYLQEQARENSNTSHGDWLKHQADMILDTWQLCHDLKANIEANELGIKL